LSVHIIAFFSSVTPKRQISYAMDKLGSTKARVYSPEDYLKEGLKRDRTIRDQHNYLFVGTGGTEDDIVQFLEKAKLPPPILLLSYEQSNSLPSAMEIRTHLEQEKIPTRIIHDSLDNLVDRINDWCSFADVINRIRTSRIGIIGKPSSWLIASEIDRSEVARNWGVEFKDYGFKVIKARMKDDLWEEFAPELETFLTQAQTNDCKNEDIQQAAIVAQALTAFAKNHDLNAVTMECFKLLQDTGVSGCYATSHLNTLENHVAGCEGDIPTTFTMLLAKYLTNQSAFMANVVDVNQDTNSVVFAHCTVPTNILDSYDITSHFESGKSVAIRGRFPFRNLTVFKVFGKDLSNYWVSEGVITKNLTNEFQCRTQIRTTLTDPVSYFLNSSLANHHVIIPGKHKRRILDFFDFIRHQ
jgi:L-fucose isomerase-like protein